MSRTKLRILFLEFEYEVLCRLQAESEAVMGLINKEKVLRGVGTVSYTHLDVYKRQIQRCENVGRITEVVTRFTLGTLCHFFQKRFCGRGEQLSLIHILLALEDKTARSIGVSVAKSRMVISVIAVLLAAISTAVIGAISFLGLIVPHIARLLVGSSHKTLVPYSALLGAVVLLLADTVGRTITAPYEISASVIMSVVGGPFFILLLRRSKQGYAK